MILGLGRTIFGFSVLGHVYAPSGLAGLLVFFFFWMYEGLLLILPYLLSKYNSIIFLWEAKM